MHHGRLVEFGGPGHKLEELPVLGKGGEGTATGVREGATRVRQDRPAVARAAAHLALGESASGRSQRTTAGRASRC